MKNYFNRIFRYTLPYKRFFLLNIFTNIFYALFGTLSMISLFPMLKVLFNQTESLTTEPIWVGIGDIGNYAEAYLNYFVTIKKIEGNVSKVSIRVDVIGDKPYAELLYKRIDDELNVIVFDDQGMPVKFIRNNF